MKRNKMKRNKRTATTEIIEPPLATTFHRVYESGYSEYRRGIPASPRKCMGKKVKLTPTNITPN